jgi:hypothetical protein
VHAVYGATHKAVYERPQYLQQVQRESHMLSYTLAKFSMIRNVVPEKISRQQTYPCGNRQRGCRDPFSVEHIAEHLVICIYENIKMSVSNT